MRAFIGIPFIIENKLNEVLDILYNQEYARISLVKKENLHLTLAFFYDLNEVEAEKIKKGLSSLKSDSVILNKPKLKFFPKNTPRIVEIGFEYNTALDHLKIMVDSIIDGIKYDKKPFKPHVTLGRIKKVHDNEKLTELLGRLDVGESEINLNEIVLYKSTLTPEGPVYEKLFIVKLQD